MSIIRNTPRMNFVIEESFKRILVQQNWQYTWLNNSGTSPWTYAEKKDFHSDVDNLIWGQWSGKYGLIVRGSSSFAVANASNIFQLNFDIKWVLSSPHWEVQVTKILPGTFATSSVSWNSRKIKLDTEDIVMRNRLRSGINYNQYPVSHEFGHALGNSIYAYSGGHGDEYDSASLFHRDKKSIMNLGNELRRRHIDFVLLELNGLIRNTIFSYVSH